LSNYSVEPTLTTPKIVFNAETGEISVIGSAIMDNAEAFFAPFIAKVEEYAKVPKENTVLNLNLKAINVAASKRILFLLFCLQEFKSEKYSVTVNWFFNEENEDIRDLGEDYNFMVNLNFNFIACQD
jgi:hypothetical protein